MYDYQSEYRQPHQNLVYNPIQRLIDVLDALGIYYTSLDQLDFYNQ